MLLPDEHIDVGQAVRAALCVNTRRGGSSRPGETVGLYSWSGGIRHTATDSRPVLLGVKLRRSGVQKYKGRSPQLHSEPRNYTTNPTTTGEPQIPSRVRAAGA